MWWIWDENSGLLMQSLLHADVYKFPWQRELSHHVCACVCVRVCVCVCWGRDRYAVLKGRAEEDRRSKHIGGGREEQP